jgi:hypothetical protein
MYNSAELLSDLSTTELVQLKDGVDAEIGRLDNLVREASNDPDTYPQAREFAGWRKQKVELGWKLSVIIEARLEEDKGRRAMYAVRSILEPAPTNL